MTPTIFSLVVAAAFIHAFWNILLKRAKGGLSFTWFVCVLQSVVFAPWIVWVIYTEKPALGPVEWVCITGSAVIHIGYYYFLQRGYRTGDISLVYPIARGSGPMLSSLAAIVFLGERPGLFGVLGIAAIGGGIFWLSGGIGKNGHPQMKAAVVAGLLTGVSIAGYTVWDKYAVSSVHLSPVLLDLLANSVQALLLTPVAWQQREQIARYWQQNKGELFGVTLLNPISYILILTVLTVAPVSQIAPMREISTLIGALVGGRLFAEKHLRRRLAAASVIVIGVLAVAHG
jgi:drug/metabolite transporter (DMT)-like permease